MSQYRKNPYQRPSQSRDNMNSQMMDNLNFNNDFFFGNLSAGMDTFDDPMDSFFSGGFGRMHQNMLSNFFNDMHFGFENSLGRMEHQMRDLRGGNGNQGTVISKSYVKKVDYSSGKPVEESYQSQSIKQYGKDGHNIHEKQEAYKNSDGIEKASHQRLLDDRGQKCIKQRNRRTGEQEMKNIYKGMNEEDLDEFNKNYNDYRQKSNFQKNYELLGKMNVDHRRMIGNGQQRRSNNYNAPIGGYLPGNASSGNQGVRKSQNYNPKSNYNSKY